MKLTPKYECKERTIRVQGVGDGRLLEEALDYEIRNIRKKEVEKREDVDTNHCNFM
jgi:hypothetical protein